MSSIYFLISLNYLESWEQNWTEMGRADIVALFLILWKYLSFIMKYEFRSRIFFNTFYQAEKIHFFF